MAKNDIPVDVVPDELLKRTKNIVGAVAGYRKENPVYMPFAPGAKTGERRRFDEDVLRDRRNFEEDVFRDRRNFDEGVRQFNSSLAVSAMRGGGSGSGGSTFNPTQTELMNMATADAYRRAVNRYNRNLSYKGKVEDGQPNYLASQYPLYYTLNSLLKNEQEISHMMATGADAKAVIDSLIYTKAGVTPEEYFSTGKGADLKAIYDAKFPETKADSVDSYLDWLKRQNAKDQANG